MPKEAPVEAGLRVKMTCAADSCRCPKRWQIGEGGTLQVTASCQGGCLDVVGSLAVVWVKSLPHGRKKKSHAGTGPIGTAPSA